MFLSRFLHVKALYVYTAQITWFIS